MDISQVNDLLKWCDLWSRSIISKWSFEANDLDHFFDLDLLKSDLLQLWEGERKKPSQITAFHDAVL